MEAYPAVQTELRAALKAAFPGPGQPSVEDILGTDIPYFDATCEEVFRLAATAKGSMREATVDTQILGCRVPKGAQIFINFHIDRPAVPVDESKRSAGSKAAVAKLGDGLQGDAGRDLGVLEPRRWLVRDDKTGEEVFNAYAMPALAFGGGYRGCFGMLRPPPLYVGTYVLGKMANANYRINRTQACNHGVPYCCRYSHPQL